MQLGENAETIKGTEKVSRKSFLFVKYVTAESFNHSSFFFRKKFGISD